MGLYSLGIFCFWQTRKSPDAKQKDIFPTMKNQMGKNAESEMTTRFIQGSAGVLTKILAPYEVLVSWLGVSSYDLFALHAESFFVTTCVSSFRGS